MKIARLLGAFVLTTAFPLASLANQSGGTLHSATVHTPRPRATAHPTPTPALPAPEQPHYTTDPQRCVHAGGSTNFCAQLKTGKYVSIFWSWSCHGNDCGLGGYHVWLAGSHPKAIDSSPVAVIMENAPPSGTCYYVTAYPAPNHSVAESKPSAHICVHATTTVLTVMADVARGYTRQYWVLYSDNNPQIKSFPARKYTPLTVGGTFVGTNQSQVNNFLRAAYSFSLSSLGGNSLFGATFAYDKGPYDSSHSCAQLNRASGSWQTADWISDSGKLNGKFSYSGGTQTWPIDSLLNGWDRSKPFAIFVEEAYGIGPAEFIKSSVVPDSFSCQSYIMKPRLLLKVGITE
jgi:hypothetical protein